MNRCHFPFLIILLVFVFGCKSDRPGVEYTDLIPFLEDAETVTDTRWINIGSPESRLFLTTGWGADQKDQNNISYSILDGRKASLTFHCLTISEKQLNIRCKTSGDTPVFLIPVINQLRLKAQKVSQEFADHSWIIPADALQSGRNEMSLVIRDGEGLQNRIAIDTIRFSDSGGKENPRQEKIFSTRIEHGIEHLGAVGGPVPLSISTYARIPSHGQIEFRYGIVREGYFHRTGAEFSIYLEDQKGHSQKLHSQEIFTSLISSGRGSLILPAETFSNQIVRITMETFPLKATSIPRRIYWQAALANPAETADQNRNARRAPSRTNIFFYLMDAARADHLQAYGYSRITSPRINEFSKTAVLFENAYTHASWTRPAVATILTGLYPSAHRVLDRIDTLPESVTTLQRLLHQNGYQNYCFTAQPNIGPTFRFERDFDVFKLITKDPNHQAQSDRVYQELQAFMTGREFRNAFFYIHVIDTHRPYLPLPEFQNAFGNCRATEQDFSREDKVSCAAEQYDSLVLQSDTYFGKFLDLLKAKNLFNDSLIILTADHGESFWEHGEMGHGKSLYQSEIRVPLIVHFPQENFQGMRIPETVRHIDLFSTILETAGVPKPAASEGSSLLGVLNKTDVSERPVFSELSLDQVTAKSLIEGNYKIIYQGGAHPGYQLFDLRKDPEEKNNLAYREPIVFGYMRQRLNQWTREQIKKGAAHKSEKAVLDQETEEMLKGLGYLQ